MAFDSTTINKTGKQYVYTGRGPLDPKSLVDTYAQLTNAATWTEGSSIIAYNGMIVAVWNNTTDTSKNGVYFFHDATVTSKFNTPDVTNEANWHRLGGINSLPGLADQIAELESDLDQIKADVKDLQDAATIIKDTKEEFPKEGLPGKIYVATKEATTYVWYNNEYMPVGDGTSNDVEIQIIHGGNASG